MKKYASIYYLFMLAFVVSIGSCKKDDPIPNGPPPIGDGIVMAITGELGEEIIFTGTITDQIGLSSISMVYANWELGKTIELNDKPLSYDLNYKFRVPDDATPGPHTIVISVLNTSEKTTDVNVIVTVANPVPTGTVASPIEVAPEGDITFTGSFADKIGLSNVNIVYAPWSLNETISIADSPTNYALSHPFTIPAEATLGDHNVEVSVLNTSGETTTFDVIVTVTEAPTSYDAIWAAGSFQWWTWDATDAYMMLQDPDDEEWFEILVHAWSGGYDEIKFLGQQSWDPDNWGLIDQSDPSQGMINSDASEAIIMGADASANYPAYYKVRFNPYTLSYSSVEVIINEPVQSEMYIVGSGFTDFPAQDWSPADGIAMTANPYDYGNNLFLIESLQFSDDVSLKFIGQTTGWSPIDIGFDETYIIDEDDATGGYQVTAPISWIPTASGSGTADLKFVNQAGYYTILYDHNAKRAIIWKE